jgi:hypothetical protein
LDRTDSIGLKENGASNGTSGSHARKPYSNQEKIDAKVDADLREMTATESGAVAERQEVANEETAVETILAQEDRARDQQPAVGYRNGGPKTMYEEPLKMGAPGM